MFVLGGGGGGNRGLQDFVPSINYDSCTLLCDLECQRALSLCRFKVDLTPFPTINRVTAALKELRVFQVSAPSEQPDCPPDLKN